MGGIISLFQKILLPGTIKLMNMLAATVREVSIRSFNSIDALLECFLYAIAYTTSVEFFSKLSSCLVLNFWRGIDSYDNWDA